jgi:hypothetical protein
MTAAAPGAEGSFMRLSQKPFVFAASAAGMLPLARPIRVRAAAPTPPRCGVSDRVVPMGGDSNSGDRMSD